jgi:hypothetical protein
VDHSSAERITEKNKHKPGWKILTSLRAYISNTFPGQISQLRNPAVVSDTGLLAPLLTAFLVMLYLLLRLWNLFDSSLWGGEIFAIYGIRQDWVGMIAYYVDDIVHPPFFYLLLRFWVAIGGESAAWLKLLPFFFSAASIVPFLLLSRELHLRPIEINLALFFMTVNGFLIHYAQEVRNYILLFFFGLFSCWLFARFFKNGARRDLIWLFVVNLLMVYSHYYGWLVVGLEFLFLLLWDRKKIDRFLTSVIGVFLLFLPWAYLILLSAMEKQGLAQNLDWITRPGPQRVANFFMSLNGQLSFFFPLSILIGLALFGIPVFLWLLRILSGRQAGDPGSSALFWWLSLFTFVPLAAIFFTSYVFPQAMWIDRYFIFVAAPYLLLVSIAALRIRPTWARNAIVASLVVWSALAGYQDMITNRVAWESPQLGSRMEWESLAKQISLAEQAQTGPVKIYTLPVLSKGIHTGFWAVDQSLNYYFELLGDERFEIEYAHNLQMILKDVQDSHFWVALFDLGQFQNVSPQEVFLNNGYSVEATIEERHLGNRLIFLSVSR